MALPRKLMAARLTNSALGSVLDNNTGADVVDLGGLGSLESAICDIFGFTIDSNITATALGMSNAGLLTKAQIFQAAAGPVGWRIRDTTGGPGVTGTDMRIVMSGSVLQFDANTTGDEATPIWTTRFSINASTGVLTGTTFSSAHAGLAPASDGSATKYLNGSGTYTVPSGSATATSCRLRHSVDQSIPDSTFTALSFDTETWDTNAMHSGASPTRITFPSTGKYMVIGTVSFAANTAGRRMLDIFQNSVGVVSRSDIAAAYDGATWLTVSTTVTVTTIGDYCTLKAFQDSGGSLNASAGGLTAPVFTAYRIGG
jgi:hypothetical protein